MYIVTSRNKAKPEIVGSKAWNLFILKKYFLVPEFAVITTEGFKSYREHKRIVPEIADELRKTLEYFLRKGPVAIRSSGVNEDLPGISFAGMYSTTLNVKNIDECVAAVVQTWNSVDSKRVKSYCERMNVSTGEMAVLIQHQLNPDISGVMVTQSPFSVNEVLVECCRGLGEKLVSGEITPTRYRLKDKKVIAQKGKNLLSKSQVLKLLNTAKRIEKILKSPQDIEWAIENRKFHILQSRPVSVHASEPRRKCTVWSNVNVRETIPDPVSPMGWSLFNDTIFPIIMRNVFGFPISHQQYKKFRPIELLSGRLYWNVNNMIAYGKPIGPILDLMEAKKSMDPQLSTAFKAVDMNNLPKILSPIRMFTFSIISFIRLIYYILLGFFRYGWLSKKIKKSYKDFNVMYERLEPTDDVLTGAVNVKKWLRLIMSKFARRYFGGLFLSMFYLMLLSRLLRLRMGKKGEAIARKSIIGLIDKTGEMVISINNLALTAQAKMSKVTIANLKKLYKTDSEFKDLFNEFINDFGHRGPAEFDIANPNWRDDYEMVYRFIQAAKNCRKYDIDRRLVIKDLLQSCRPMEIFILKMLIPRIEAFTPLRENAKHIFLKATAKLKDQLFLVEDILHARGYVKKDRDIFFLALSEIDAIAETRYKKTDILKLIEKRKKEWKVYRQTEAPEIIYESGERITASFKPSQVLSGESLSYGKIKGRVRIIKNFNESSKLRDGEILVTHHTDPGWTPLFNIASGVIIEAGGVICHAAMVARELGIPAIVIKGATKLIPDGTVVELDADTGQVTIISNVKDQIFPKI